MSNRMTQNKTERDTSFTPPILAIAGEISTAAATPIRALAISSPIAKAISLPFNHLTIPFDTVIPAISTPQPKIIKPKAAILAEEGMPS